MDIPLSKNIFDFENRKKQSLNIIHIFLLNAIIMCYMFSGSLVLFLPFVYLKFHYAVLAMIVILLAYRIRIPIEYNGALSINWMRSNKLLCIAKSAQPWETSFMERLDKNEMLMFVGYPHGLLPTSWIFFMSDLAKHNLFPRALGGDIIMRIPCLRELALLFGTVNASWKSTKIASEQKKSLFLLPGSAREMKYNNSRDKSVYIIKRTGFIKAALQYGYTLVPVVGVGVTDLYSALLIPSEWCNKVFRVYPFLPFGKYGFCYPRSAPVHNIIGRPIKVEMNTCYTEEDVAELSDRFYEGLQGALNHYNSVHSESYCLKCVTD